MKVITMTNGQMGFSCFEGSGTFHCRYSWKPHSSCEFLNYRRPLFGFPLNTSNRKKTRIFGFGLRIKAMSNGDLDKRLVGVGFLEKEFEFKPSFGDYLKAMESVKTGQEKKQVRKLSGRKLKDDSRRNNTRSLGKTEKTGKLRNKGFMDQENVSEVMKGDELGLGDNVDGASDQWDVNNNELVYKERKVESRIQLAGREADTNVKRRERGLTEDGQCLLNQTHSMDAKSEDLYQDTSKKTPSAQKIHMVVNDTKKSKSSTGTKDEFSCGKSLPEILERKGKTIEREKVGIRGNKLNGRPVRNHIQIYESTYNEIVQKKRFPSRSNQALLDGGGDDDLEIDRAAFKRFEESKDVSPRPRASRMEMEERIQKLAKCLNGADIDMPEWMFNKMMRSAKIKYTDHTVLRIIQILGKLGNWRRVLQVIEWLQMRERFKSYRLRYVYTTALNVLGKAQRPMEALNIFYAMQQQMSSYPDLVAYRSIAVTLGQAGHMEQLFDLIDSMRSPPKKKFKMALLDKWDPRLEPDVVVFNAVLNACVQRKQWEGAFWVLQQLKQQGLQPSVATYGLIMEVMNACGKYNLVHEFYRKVQKLSIPNAIVYKVLVSTLWKEGKVDEAVLAVQEMERRGIVGSAALYYDLARCLCSAGRCQEALLQIEKISKVANKPLVVTYTGLIQACLDSGQIQNAVYIFNQMKQFCSPNLVTCNIMLKAYIDHGLFEDAKDIFHQMSEDSNCIRSKSGYKLRVMPDIYAFNTMLDACIAEKSWDDFEYVYGRMLQLGYHFNGKRHLWMILEASRAGKEKPLELTWKHLARTDRIPPPPLIKERFCRMLEKCNCSSALACITTSPINPIEELHAFSKKSWLNLFKENAQRFRRDTLIQLAQEVSVLVAKSNPPNPVLQNLLTACNDFLKTHVEVPGGNLTAIVCTVRS